MIKNEEQRIDTNSSTKMINLEEILDKECTAKIFGNAPILQILYKCPFCDPLLKYSICKSCYENCHSKCRLNIGKKEEDKKFLKIDEEIQGQVEKEFACDCFLKLKHEIKMVEKKKNTKCPLAMLDRKFLKTKYFYCEDENVRICSFCYFKCHKKCKTKKLHLDERNKNNRFYFEDGTDFVSNSYICECTDDNHSTYNEFSLNIPVVDYQTECKISFWPIQLINILFSSKEILGKLIDFFKETINSCNTDTLFKHNSAFPFLIEQFSNTFNKKFKTFYYHNKVLDIFDFQKVIKLMKAIKPITKEMSIVKYRLIFIIIFIHIKKDFTFQKELTSIDFITNSILERILFKKFIFTKTLFTNEIHEKYRINEQDCECLELKELILDDLCTFILSGLNKGLLNVLEYQDELEIGLKLICIVLKRKLFNCNELEILINKLCLFHDEFLSKIKLNTVQEMSTWLDIFSTEIEIFFMIAVNYNDLVVEDYLINGSTDKNFIHYESAHGKVLYQMLLKSLVVLKKHYEFVTYESSYVKNASNEDEKKEIMKAINYDIGANPNGIKYEKPKYGILDDKILLLFHETLKIFSITENKYYTQLNSITPEQLTNFYVMYHNIEKCKEIPPFNNESENYLEEEYKKQHSDLYFCLNLTMKIEDYLKQLFLSSYEESSASSIENFFVSQYSDYVLSISKNISKYQMNEKNNLDEFRLKIIEKYANINIFLKEDFTYFDFDKYVNNMIYSNIDGTVLKVLIFFSNKRFPIVLTYELLSQTLAILSPYLLTECGLRYFIQGKTFSRLNKLFHRYSIHDSKTFVNDSKNLNVFQDRIESNIKMITIILEFSELLFQAINYFNIDISEHKVLPRFVKHYMSHLKNFNKYINYIKNGDILQKKKEFQEKFNKLECNLKEHIIIIMTILDYIFPYCNNSTQNEIFTNITNLLCDSKNNILMPKYFYEFYFNKKEREENSEDINDPFVNLLKEKDNLDNNEINSNKNQKNNLDKNNINIKKTPLMNEEMINENNVNEMSVKISNININIIENKQNESETNIHKIKLHLQLIYQLFKLIINSKIIIKKKECLKLKEIVKFLLYKDPATNEFCVMKLFKGDYIGLEHKYIFLNLMQKLFFMEECENENFKYISQQITTDEYYNYLISQENQTYPSILEAKKAKDEAEKLKLIQQSTEIKKGRGKVKKERYNIKKNKVNTKVKNKYLNRQNNVLKVVQINKAVDRYKRSFGRRSVIFISQNDNEINEKLEKIKQIELMLDIYINEIINISSIITQSNINTISVSNSSCNNKEYVINLVLGIKNISDFFYYETNIWQKPIIKFYNISKVFLEKIHFIINFLTENINGNSDKNLDPNDKIFEDLNLKQINIFEKEKIYKKMCNAFDLIFKYTKINENFSISNYLKNYENKVDLNFSPPSLIDHSSYDCFYENDEEEKESEVIQTQNNEGQGLFEKQFKKLLDDIITKYTKEFIDINKTNFESVIINVTNDINQTNYRALLVEYFTTYINCGRYDDMLESIIYMVTKMTFYDIAPMQNNFQEKVNKEFFCNLLKLIQSHIFNGFVLAKNVYEYKRFEINTSNTKLFLQFTQLLGEGFNDSFHDKIFDYLNDSNNTSINKELFPNKMENENSDCIFSHVTCALKKLVEFFELSKDYEAELPYDKLIVLFTNLVDFVIEYIVTKVEYSITLQSFISELLFSESQVIQILKEQTNTGSKYRTNILSYVKTKILELLISYLQNGKKKKTYSELLKNNFTAVEIYTEILKIFKLLLESCKNEGYENEIKSLENTSDDDTYVKKLVSMYINNEYFQNSLELSVCFNFFILIKIYETKYHNNDLKEQLKKINENREKSISTNEINKNSGQKQNEKDEQQWDICSKNSLRIFKFLNEIVLFVEIKIDAKNNKMDLTAEIENEDENEIEFVESSINNYQLTFFIRPFLTYYLSGQTQKMFQDTVKRDNAVTKYMGLVSNSDYFLFEMVVNKRTTKNSNFIKFFSDLNYNLLEIFNFLLIFIENVILVIDNYKSTDIQDLDEYNTRDDSKLYKYNKIALILVIFQILYILFVLICWFYYKFALSYTYRCLMNENLSFVYRKKSDCGKKPISTIIKEFFDEKINVNVYPVINEFSKDVSLTSKLYLMIFESVLFNREICVFIYNLILIILYLATKNNIFLILCTLFISNLSTTLFALVKSIYFKWKHLAILLGFAYLIVYIIMWFIYFFLYKNLIKDDVRNLEYYTNSTQSETMAEAFCSSPVQCWLMNVNYGIRAGGGIADAMAKASYKDDPGYFILRLIHDDLYYILIFLMMINLFLGIVVDAFAELRGVDAEREKDINNTCFICQISKDDCLVKSIDFDEHIKNEHNMWNYVYFLTYLHLENVLDFNSVKKYVWDKLGKQDNCWFPMIS